jgi:lipopolysaccharide transport system ATP-binding protein
MSENPTTALAVHARGLRKVYRLYRKPGYRALDIMGLLPERARYFGEHVALHDLNLDIARGEKVAIIGRNGAGKSTLLRLITGVVQPTAGTLKVNGTTQALLSLGTGFHPELTGRENALAYLANFGITGDSARRLLGEIIEFAEIEEYVDQPVKTYSSGMTVRLMFAASTMFAPDLLVIDEVLGVGDAYFQAKSFERIREICKAKGTTLLLVTHDVFTASMLCERMIWIDHGAILLDADSPTVLKAYDASIRQQEEARLRKKAILNLQQAAEEAREAVSILVIELRSPTNTPAPAPVQIARLALLDGETTVAEAALVGGIEEAQTAGRLITDSGVWGDVTTWNGRLARTINNFGASLHKVALSFLLPKAVAARVDDLALEVECGAADNYTLEAWRIDADLRTRSLGLLPSNPGHWNVFRAPLSGAGGAAVGVATDLQAAAIVAAAEQHGSRRITVEAVHFLDEFGNDTLQLEHGRAASILIDYVIHDSTLAEHCELVLAFRRNGVDDMFRLFGRSLFFDGTAKKSGQVRIVLPRLPLGVAEYSVTVLVAAENYYEEKPTLFFSINPKVYFARRGIVDIKVTSDQLIPSGTGVVGDAEWSFAEDDAGSAPQAAELAKAG